MLQQLHPFGIPFFGSVTPFAVPFFPAPRISGVGVSVIGLRGEALDNFPALPPTTVEEVMPGDCPTPCKVYVPEFD
jgi:hypothetical protein